MALGFGGVRWTPRQEASLHDDNWEPGTPGYGKVSDFNWRRVRRFPVGEALGKKATWKKWFLGEQKMFIEAEGFDRYGPSFHAALAEPIVVVHQRNGKYYIWDGHHRVGYALTHDVEFLPAIVGERKTS